SDGSSAQQRKKVRTRHSDGRERGQGLSGGRLREHPRYPGQLHLDRGRIHAGVPRLRCAGAGDPGTPLAGPLLPRLRGRYPLLGLFVLRLGAQLAMSDARGNRMYLRPTLHLLGDVRLRATGDAAVPPDAGDWAGESGATGERPRRFVGTAATTTAGGREGET